MQQLQLQQNRQYQTLHNAPQTREVAIASPSLNVKAIRGLAITQMVIGSFVIVLGIASIAILSTLSLYHWRTSGLWYGGWTLSAGIIGFFSTRKPFSESLIGINMGFNIVCVVFSSLLVILYSLTIYSLTIRSMYFNDHTSEICYILLILMVAEFAVSLAISILCCKGACCGVGSCHQSSTGNPMPHHQMIGIATQPSQQSHEIGQRKSSKPNQTGIHQQQTLKALQQPNSGVIINIQGATANDVSQMNV